MSDMSSEKVQGFLAGERHGRGDLAKVLKENEALRSAAQSLVDSLPPCRADSGRCTNKATNRVTGQDEPILCDECVPDGPSVYREHDSAEALRVMIGVLE